MVVLLETKHQVRNIQHLKQVTGLQNMYSLDSTNSSRGLCALWSQEIDVSIGLSLSYFIEFQVLDSVQGVP